jgi:hypothetical protein
MPDTPAASRPRNSLLVGIGSYLELIGAAVLVGGLGAAAAIGAVTFGSPDVLSHEQAGRLMARVFEGSIFVEAAAVAITCVGALLAGRLRRAVGVLVMAGALVLGHVALGDQMRDIRLSHGGSLSALEKDHPDRMAFGKRHGVYNVLALGLVGFGLGVLRLHARGNV